MEFKEVIERINYLYNKSKNEELTNEEKVEQKELREYYIKVFKSNFRNEISKVKKVN
ncbi:hypothetical protein SH2C18_51810 [Clostridium sediminicola]|uniref:DUF896 domain-containing protein n=1 Tax=Clostridium sediminicola TaxID=3114879 RepID=UPI0031F1F622